MTVLHLVLTVLIVVASSTTDAFVAPISSSSFPSLLSAESSSSSSAGATSTTIAATTDSSLENIGYTVQVVDGGEDDARVVDVASYRNGIVSPQMMVDRAQKKRDGMDNNKAALDGLKIGLLYVGPVVAVGTYFSSSGSDTLIVDAIKNYGIFGGGLGAILGGNSYMGRSVHVPDVPEATNRIVVDLSEGLLRKQDMGFIATISNNDDNVPDQRFFAPSNGVIATVDAQLRNSPDSPKGVRTIDDYPSHLHIKNMDVHYKKRRQGVGFALLESIAEHAKTKTDAKLLTLEVEAINQNAVQLYRKFGFETRDKNPNKRSNNVFMAKELYK